MGLFIKRNDTNEIIKVRKYIIDSDGFENIWVNDWYGKHKIGYDCEWITTDIIDKQIKKQFGSWTAFCSKYGHDHKNFKRKLLANIDKINKWLEPLDLHIVFKKGQKK